MVRQRKEIRPESPQWWSRVVSAAKQDIEDRNGKVWEAVRNAYTGRTRNGSREEYGGVQIDSRGRPRLESVRPPRMFSLVSGMETMLFNRNPKGFVRAFEGRLEKFAKDYERIINAMWRRYVSPKDLRWMIRDTALYGRSWGLLGYDTDEEEERKRLLKRREEAQTLTQAALSVGQPVDEVAVAVEPVQAIENEVEPETYAGDSRNLARRPSFRRLPPMDVTPDPDAMTEFDMQWVDYSSYVSIETLRADPFMRGASKVQPARRLDRDSWGGVAKAGSLDSPMDIPREGSKSREAFEYAHIHYTAVKRPGGTWDVLIYAHDHDFFLRKMIAPYWFGCPFVTLAWGDDGDSLETVGDGERLLPGIVEEASIRKRLKDHWNRKPNDVVAVDSGLLSNTTNKATIEVAGTATFLPIKNESPDGMQKVPLSNHFFPIPRNANIAEVYQHLQLIERDYMAVTGLGPNQQLQAMKSETSSYEAQEVARNARARGVEKQEAVELFAAKVMHMLGMLAAQYSDAERIAELTSGEVAARWRAIKFTPGDVQDGFGVEVERGSMRPQSSESRIALYSQLLQMALSNPAFAVGLNLDEIFKSLMEENGILDGSKIFNQGVSMDAVLKAMMQAGLAGLGKGGGAQKPGGSTEVPK